jgi:hypothetical protein
MFCVLVNNTNDGLTGAKYLQSFTVINHVSAIQKEKREDCQVSGLFWV